MTYGIARAATSPELALYRTPNKKTKWRAAIQNPRVVYTARVNQVFSTTDGILEIAYDTGSGTLADVLPDMTILVGSSASAHDVGICRLRDKDSDTFFIGETSDIQWADNLYLTVLEDFSLWARHVLISGGVVYMDGGVTYSDQHEKPEPTPIMGSNRVLKLTGATVSTQYSFGNSYVVGGLSSISTYSTSAPTAQSVTDPTTSTPTVTFDTTGCHPVYLTLTAANGKVYFGIRWVYVWSDDDPPLPVKFGTPRQDTDSGGWEFEMTMYSVEAGGYAAVRDHALVILFSEDYFGNTQSNIGPVEGSENVEITGWIGKESIKWNPEQGTVTFTVYTAQYFFGQIPGFPGGVELTTGTPSAWTQFQNLTVDKGLWHFLHWRTTATRVMDVFLTGDTKYTKEVSSMAGNLWEQIREMGFLQIYARPGVNAHNQLFIEINPQLVPSGSRTWANVMEIVKGDWEGEINFERVTTKPIAVLSLTGIAVNSSGIGSPFFSLAPGHAYPHYGGIEVQDRILVASQSQSNILAGLYRSWRNNDFPDLTIRLKADIRLIDCFPRQKCYIQIAADDTVRGITYTGYLLPKSISIVHDDETGKTYREVTFEVETLEGIAINGDIPGGRSDPSVPPSPSFPPLPPLSTIIPGPLPSSLNGPTKVLFHDTVKGVIYTPNFDAASPSYATVNAGLTSEQYTQISFMRRTPNGAVYVGAVRVDGSANYAAGAQAFLARAPYPGGTFTVLFTEADFRPAAYPSGVWGIWGLGINLLHPEQIGMIAGAASESEKFYLITYGSATPGAIVDNASNWSGNLSYGAGYWLYHRFGAFWRLNPSGSSVVASGTEANLQFKSVRASTTGRVFFEYPGPALYKTDDNLITTPATFLQNMAFPGLACDPAGNLLMGKYGAGLRGRSADGGATWATMGSLPFATNHNFAYAGNSGDSFATSRWIAAGSIIRYSPDWGDSWYNKEGNIFSIRSTPDLDLIEVVGY